MTATRNFATMLVLLAQAVVIVVGGAGARACFTCDPIDSSLAVVETACGCCCADESACPCCDPSPIPVPERQESECPSLVNLPAVLGEGLRLQTVDVAHFAAIPVAVFQTLLPTPSESSVAPPALVIDTGPPEVELNVIVMLV